MKPKTNVLSQCFIQFKMWRSLQGSKFSKYVFYFYPDETGLLSCQKLPNYGRHCLPCVIFHQEVRLAPINKQTREPYQNSSSFNYFCPRMFLPPDLLYVGCSWSVVYLGLLGLDKVHTIR